VSGEPGARRAVPIACTLATEDVPERVTEWQSFFRSSVTATESGRARVRLRLEDSAATMAAAESLAARETQCCAFFTFAFTTERGQRWVTVSVPEEAEPALDTFMSMLKSGTGLPS
jgi:hypothetical protein